MTPKQQEIAETLYCQWAAQKELNCYRRQLCRAAKTLGVLSKAIETELAGGPGRPLVTRVRDQRFTVDPANLVAGGGDTHDLPTVEELAALTEGYRAACQALEDANAAVDGL